MTPTERINAIRERLANSSHDEWHLFAMPNDLVAAKNADLIAHAPADLKWLLARLDRLTEALKNLSARHRWHAEMGECICEQHKVADQALAEQEEK